VRRLLPLLVLVGLTACGAENGVRGGTSVGNPGEVASSMASATRGAHAFAAVDRAALQWVDCDGGTQTVPIDGVLDLLAPTPQEAPAGTWCAVELVHDTPVVVQGGDASGTYALTLDVPVVHVEFPTARGLEVDGQRLVLEVGKPGWLDLDALGVVGGADVSVGVADPEHEALARALAFGSAVFVDNDEDGEVDDDERGEGSVGEGSEYEDDDDETDD
jgi:hypothetical protein